MSDSTKSEGQEPVQAQSQSPVSGQNDTPASRQHVNSHQHPHNHGYSHGNGPGYLIPGNLQVGAAVPTLLSSLALGMLQQGENA
jgi:hypothetical protein